MGSQAKNLINAWTLLYLFLYHAILIYCTASETVNGNVIDPAAKYAYVRTMSTLYHLVRLERQHWNVITETLVVTQ